MFARTTTSDAPQLLPLRLHRVVLLAASLFCLVWAGLALAQQGTFRAELLTDDGHVIGVGELRDGTLHFRQDVGANGFATLRVESGGRVREYTAFVGAGGDVRVLDEDFDLDLVDFFRRLDVEATVERDADVGPEDASPMRDDEGDDDRDDDDRDDDDARRDDDVDDPGDHDDDSDDEDDDDDDDD